MPTLPLEVTTSLGAPASLSQTAKFPLPTPALPLPESIQYSRPPVPLLFREIAASVPVLSLSICALDAPAESTSKAWGLFCICESLSAQKFRFIPLKGNPKENRSMKNECFLIYVPDKS
jgi:hypothetical protein